MDIQKALDEINVLIKDVTDPVAKIIISRLLNIIEALMQENKMLKAENQKLRNEINRLKGEQGKPDIRTTHSRENISSEKERNQHGKGQFHRRSKSKNHKIKINKIVRCKINPDKLPEDAVFK